MTIDYESVHSVRVRDGIVYQSSVVWWHGEDGPIRINLKAPHLLMPEWENIVRFPLIYSLQEPLCEIDNDGFAVYDYEYPYKD